LPTERKTSILMSLSKEVSPHYWGLRDSMNEVAALLMGVTVVAPAGMFFLGSV
jgi:hypothetical protein